MTSVLDASVLVRYLTLDPPHQGARAKALIESEERLTIPVVALLETAFVLTRLYKVERAQMVDLLIGLIARSNLTVLDVSKGLTSEALLLCRDSGRVSFGDALIWAAAREAEAQVLYTFDRRFPTTGLDCRLLAIDE